MSAKVNLPGDWDRPAHTLWLADQRNEALQAVLAKINLKPQPLPRGSGVQFAYYLSMQGDWSGAALVCAEVNKCYPDDLEVLLNLGVCLHRSEQAARAAQTLEKVVEHDADLYVAWDGLASAYANLKDYTKAAAAGCRSLELKDRATAAPARNWTLPQGTPAAFAAGKKNTISFSLFGAHPRYLRGALHNLLLAARIYPGWAVRFYVDDSVPAEFCATLADLGATLVVEADPSRLTTRQRLMRRFLVANDPSVGYFLVRDCDSVIGQRESLAVRLWIESGRWFHVMRDWWTHSDLVLAGMWGGVAMTLPSIQTMVDSYQSSNVETPNWDQWFLRDRLWSSLRGSCLSHDRCFSALGTAPFPGVTPPGNEHVGQDEFAARREQQAAFLADWIARMSCLRLPVT